MILKLSPLIGVTISAFVWRLGILTPPTLLLIVTMAACFLTPIYTSSEKGQLISDQIKGPLAAFRSPPDEGTRQERRNVGSMN